MTREQKQDLRDAIDADLAGKPVQFFDAVGTGGTWRDVVSPGFSSSVLWRPKPEPKTRLWRPEDVPMPCWVRYSTSTATSGSQPIHGVLKDGVWLLLGAPDVPQMCLVDWDTLQYWLYSTDGRQWQPCTVTES